MESADVPVPGVAVLLAAAFAAARGALALPWVIVTAAVASVLGDNLGFALGRRLGRGWLARYGPRVFLTPERIAVVDRFFERHGPLAVALARFVAGVRVVAAFTAGASRMPWSTFVRYNVLGAVAWATLVSVGGYAVGRGYSGASAWLGHAGVVLAIVVPAALLAAWLLRRVAVGDVARKLRPAWLSGVAVHSAVVFGTCAAAVLTFAAIAEEVGEGDAAAFDTGLRAWMLAHHAAAATPVFAAFTWFGSTPVIGPVAALVALWLWHVRAARVAGVAAATPLVALAFIGGLKVAFHRTRPPGAFHDPRLANALHYSFPSGHATASAAIASTLAYILTRERLAPRWLSTAAAVLFPLLVGLSRVYLDVHWASDVVGGWVVGMAVAWGAVPLYERTRPTAAATSA